MTLPEVVKLIREKKGWNQRELAAALGYRDQQRISEMENAGPTWQKHLEAFMRLLPLCHDLNIDITQPARLPNNTSIGRDGDVDLDLSTQIVGIIAQNVAQKPGRVATADTDAVPKGGSAKRRRRPRR